MKSVNATLRKPIGHLLVVMLILQSAFSASAAPVCRDIFVTHQTVVSRETDFVRRAVRDVLVDPVIDWAKRPHSRKVKDFVSVIVAQAKQATVGGIDLLLPWPTPLLNRKAIIDNKQMKNPDYQLSPAEVDFISSLPAGMQRFQYRAKFLKDHPVLQYLGARTVEARRFALTIALLVVLQQSWELEENTKTFEEFLNEKSDNGEVKTELLIESAPFPHHAIRIGDRVYSYGQTHMTSQSLYEYVLDPNKVPAETSGPEGLKGSLISLGKIAAQRSLRVVELKLGEPELNELRRELELATAKQYKNITGVNDCATMISRALKRNSTLSIPKALDPYPTTVGSYLTLRRLFGDRRVGKASMIVADKSNKASLLARNTWIGLLEAKAMVLLAPANLTHRIYIDLTVPEGDLQFYDAPTKAKIAAWQRQINREIEEELAGYGAGTNEAFRLSSDSAKSIIELVITPALADAQSVLETPNAEFSEIVTAQIKVDALVKQKKLLENQIERTPININYQDSINP